MSSEVVERLLQAVAATYADAEEKGLKKGNGGSGTLKCPACPDGEIRYSVATSNGHLWGCCTTPGCARWMQ